MEDCIAAISTSSGIGAISIIRVSGNKSIENVNKICDIDLSKKESHTINYAHIYDNNKMIDEVLITIMKAPKTFTTEDVVEINCHGGVAVTNKVLELLLQNGCRIAEPGEFTKRAFLNGRIDLLEAEGIMDMLNAKNESARKLAINNINGKLSSKIEEIRENLIQLASNISVNIDYPEYDDIPEVTNKKIEDSILIIENKIEKLIDESKNGQIIKEGIKTAIIGKPNVGKSSLLNLLIDENKAIVTDIPGTTRDIVEGSINFDGIILNLIDTAGIRKTEDIVENIGVKKSLEYINNADLIIYILNNNEEINNEELELLEKIRNKNHIILINKIDLENKLNFNKINDDYIKISVLENIGIDDLKNKIKELYNLDKINQSDYTYLSNIKDVNILKGCLKKISDIKQNLKNDFPIDMLEIDIKSIWQDLGVIIGKSYDEEFLEE